MFPWHESKCILLLFVGRRRLVMICAVRGAEKKARHESNIVIDNLRLGNEEKKKKKNTHASLYFPEEDFTSNIYNILKLTFLYPRSLFFFLGTYPIMKSCPQSLNQIFFFSFTHIKEGQAPQIEGE